MRSVVVPMAAEGGALYYRAPCSQPCERAGSGVSRHRRGADPGPDSVIVVVGGPLLGRSQDGPQPAGLSGSIAAAAATAGSTVELVGRVGEDADGEALVLALARAGVGHVALLRDPARATPVV